MKKYHKNQWGFSHHFILPLLAFVAVGAIGAYVIAKSNAATAGPSDVVYSVHPSNVPEKYYRYFSATKTSTEYSSDVHDILDVSQDQKWILSYGNNFAVSALSTSGERVSYGNLTDYNDSIYDQESCSSAATVTKDFFFSKAKTTSSGAPKLYFVEGSIPCVNGKYAATSQKPLYMKLYSVEANGVNKTAIYTFKNYISRFTVAGALRAVGINGNLQIWKEDGSNHRTYVLSSTGKVLYKSAKDQYLYLSEDGKKIAYEAHASYGKDAFYVADSNGKNVKKVLSVSTSTPITLSGISPTGSYILYQKATSKDYKTSILYSFKISSKKSYKIDSGTNSLQQWEAINYESWLPSSNTLVYVKRDSTAKTAQILQAGVTGSNKKVLVPIPYDKDGWITIY